MKILVYIGPTVDGFNNGTGSEGRYYYNLALMLAKYGHTVDCVGSDAQGSLPPAWGDCPGVPGIVFISFEQLFNENRKYDLALVPENETPYRINNVPKVIDCSAYDRHAPVVGHPLFGWGHKGLPCATDREHNNHWVILPWEPAKSHPSDAVIYYPVYEEFTEVDPATRNSIMWPCKGPYVDEWPEDRPMHTSGVKILKAMSRAAKEHNIRSVFINSECFDSERSKRLGAHEAFHSISNKTAYNGLIRKDILDNELAQCRVSTVLQNYFSSLLDSPAKGAVSVHFDNDGGCIIGNPVEKLLKESYSEDEVYEVIIKFFMDDEYYLNKVKRHRLEIEKFSWESSYRSFVTFCNKLKLEV